MKLEVACYSGYKGDERPVRFSLGGRSYLVEGVLAQWHELEEECFRVRADDGRVYILRRRTATAENEWTLEYDRPRGDSG